VEHNDISASNLMYDKLNGNRGVLNDFDLAHLKGHPRPSGTERTGTMPFMALDLLTKAAGEGKVERLYRHDCESFVWVLLWICCRYFDGQVIPNPPLSQFITADYTQCFREKFTTFETWHNISPTDSYRQFWPAVTELLEWLLDQRIARRRGRAPPDANTMDGVVKSCRETLNHKGFYVVL
jgi:hypothetical protein